VIETSNPSAPRADKAKKGKLAAKSMGHTYQFQIMESVGVLRSEVKKLADPYHWLSYFPPITTVSPDLYLPCPY
jgi:leucyl-tRNA synthetase